MRRTQVAATLVVLAIYVALPTKNYYWDGVWFAQTIEGASRWGQLVHPNHLFYNLPGYALYHLLGARVRALYVLQAMDAVFAASTVYLLFGIIRELGHSERATLLLTGFFAFSGTWWRFATDADAYIPSIFFLTLSAFFLLPGRKPRPISVAVLHGAAMMMHQLAVFFFPAAAVGLWEQAVRDEQGRRILRIVEYTAAAFTLTVTAYFLGFRAAAEARGIGFWPWLTSHAQDARFSLNLPTDTIVSLRSWVQLFLIGRVTWVHLAGRWGVALLFLAAAALLTWGVGVARHGLPQGISVRHTTVLRWASIWLGAYALFLLVWLPHNTFYKLFALPGVILIAASCTTSAAGHPWNRSPAWLVVAVAAWNLACGIVPYSHAESNEAVAFAISLRKSLPSGAIVYYSELNTDDWLARYFNPRTLWLRATTPAAVDADIDRGTPVWLETTAIDRFAREAPAWFAARTAGAPWRELLHSGHRIRFVMLHRPALQ